MIRDEQLVFKKHAVERMMDRGITVGQVKVAIERGAKFIQTNGVLAKYTYFAVAYKKRGEKYIIKTIIID